MQCSATRLLVMGKEVTNPCAPSQSFCLISSFPDLANLFTVMMIVVLIFIVVMQSGQKNEERWEVRHQ